MKYRALFLLFFLTTVLGFSQGFSVSGKVVDEQGLAISYANVILMTQQDSTLVKGTSTDEQGRFRIDGLNESHFNFKISFIGYKDFVKAISLDQDVDLGTIVLMEEAQSLDEISVVFKKPTLKKEADRLVFNVENSSLTEGNMLQVLKVTPGVFISNNGISVNSYTPGVYINNRKVNLTSSELLQLLEGSSATSIKSVEVITNPSSKYDASSGAVLNIVMSKNLVTGYRGNVFTNYTQGVFPNYNIGTSHFFKSEKINFHSNYSYLDSKTNRDDVENINYFDNNQSIDEFWEFKTNRNKWTNTHNFNMNFDYEFDTQNMLSLSSYLLFLPNQIYIKSNSTNVFDATKTLDFYYDSNNLEHDKKQNLAFDLDFVHQFSKGELSFNTHYTDYHYEQNQDVVSNYYDDDDSFLNTTAFNTYNSQDTKIFTAKADYTSSINEASTFETGIKTSFIETNSATTRHNFENGQEVLDINNTDNFDYKENVHAAYVNYSGDWEKWSLSLGLRTEQTNIKSKSIFNNITNSQDYLDWFPTASVSFKPGQKFNFYTNYKRSIERPYYQNLNPFRFYYNDNNAFVGNPNLIPIINDHVVIGTSIMDYFVVEAYYKHSKNKIHVLPRQDNTTNTLLFTPLNFDKTVEYGLDFGVNFYVAKDWSIYLLTSFYNIEDETVFDNSTVNQNQWSNYSLLQNTITFLKDRSLNMNFTVYYAGKNLQGFRVVEDRWISSLSISKSIMKKKAVISLNAEDLFNAQDYNDSTRYLNQFSNIHTNLDTRFIKLGFRYNFGNTNLKTNASNNNLEERTRLREINN